MKQATLLTAMLAMSVLLADNARAQSLKASRWIINPQMPGERTAYDFAGGIAADFPQKGDGWLGYVVTQPNGPLAGQSLSMTISIQTERVKASKAVRFIPKPSESGCVAPAALRFYFQSFGLYNDTPGTRWWSSTIVYELKEGIVTLTVPLDPHFFSGTSGEPATTMPDAFKYALAHPTYVGLTMGGCGWGHGVAAGKGDARLVILEYAMR